MTTIKRKTIRLMEQGRADALAGKSISGFYKIPKIRHTELERGAYEQGFRYMVDEMRRKNRKAAQSYAAKRHEE